LPEEGIGRANNSFNRAVLDEEGHLVLVLEVILKVRKRKLRNRVIKEFLVKWRDLPQEDATWEGDQVL